jgi:hypothetical protein
MIACKDFLEKTEEDLDELFILAASL